jgi:RHH-type proline utilization regulon transcriptional repressor/proline dehydrogenase/delta 1-pyrroline-5-carboxylate dehydrogenase
LPRDQLSELQGFDAAVCWSDSDDQRAIRMALAARDSALIPLICKRDFADHCVIERHVCIDTTAAGGNVSLLA